MFSDRMETVIKDSGGAPREIDDPCESSTVQKDQSVEYADIQYKNVIRLNRYMIIFAIIPSFILFYEIMSHKHETPSTRTQGELRSRKHFKRKNWRIGKLFLNY